jgi:hypothetical protein
MALADAADRRIAAHRPERVEVVRQQQGVRARPRRGQRSFGAGMAAADDDDIETGGIKHGGAVLQRGIGPRILRQGAEKSKFFRAALLCPANCSKLQRIRLIAQRS